VSVRRSLFAVVLAALMFAGCANDRTEAAQVVEAAMRFRRADNRDKPAMADALRTTRCTAADVCRARDACLASAAATEKALQMKNEVEKGLSAIERGTLARDSAEANALPQKLDDAENLLKQGFELLPACDDEIMALKRTYGLR